MKIMKRLTAIAIMLAMLIALALPVFASSEQTLVYSKKSNSGQKNVVCTTLEGTSASLYYTGSYTYDLLSALSDGTADNKNNALYNQLYTLMSTGHDTSSYDDCRKYAIYTDCQNNDEKVTLIYTSFQTTDDKFGSGGSVWNREHVWPKNLGGFEKTGGGADMHHIRPSDANVNSTRSNRHYGNVTGGSYAYASGLVGTSVKGGKYSGDIFEPLDDVKGDVARICLYVYVRWGSSYSKTGDITNVFESIDTLLEWCEDDPVDTWEMGRNEVVEAYQGNRNVFIDYPELAWLLFEREVPDNLVTPTSATGDVGGGDVGGGDVGGGDVGGGDVGGGDVGGGDVGGGDVGGGDVGGGDVGGGDVGGGDVGGGDVGGGDVGGGDVGGGDVGGGDVGGGDVGGGDVGGGDVGGGDVGGGTVECQHKNTEVLYAKEATCSEEGYTGDVYCKDCYKLQERGAKIAKEKHSFIKGSSNDGTEIEYCKDCGIDYDEAMKDTPAKGADAKTVAIIGGVCAVVIIGFVIIKKRR